LQAFFLTIFRCPEAGQTLVLPDPFYPFKFAFVPDCTETASAETPAGNGAAFHGSGNVFSTGRKKKRNNYNARLARFFCSLLCASEKSVTQLLKENPHLPDVMTLYKWRDKHPYFATLWKRAREAQAEHLMQKCLDLARKASPRNAHQVRVQFDIYRFFGQKVLPSIYGDKPANMSVSASVAVVISPERLNAIRAKLDASREAFKSVEQRKERQKQLPESLKQFDRENRRESHPIETETLTLSPESDHPAKEKRLKASL